MTWKCVFTSVAILGTLFGSANSVRAQAVQTAALGGTVADSTGAVLPGVTVNVTSPQQVGGVQTSVSDNAGRLMPSTDAVHVAPG